MMMMMMREPVYAVVINAHADPAAGTLEYSSVPTYRGSGPREWRVDMSAPRRTTPHLPT
jgi:hypothetical protein